LDGLICKVGVLPETPKDPCSQLKKVSTTTFYQQNIDFLKGKAAGEKEHALVYKYFSNTSSLAPPTTAGHNTENPNTVNLDAFSEIEWIGAFHNHTSGNNPTIKMFSPKDVKWLLRRALKRTNYQIPSDASPDVSDLFLGLVNEEQVYCLKIKDWSKFYLLKDDYDDFERELEGLFKQRSPETPQVQLQKDLLKLLAEYDLGIGLYDQDVNGNWSEINLDPTNSSTNPPIKTPCI